MQRLLKALSILSIVATSSTAFAYTPKWLECKGDVTTQVAGAPATKKAVTDIYVLDSDANHLFKYSEAQKTSTYIGGLVSNNILTWSDFVSKGQLNLGDMSLQIKYLLGTENNTWNERCAATSPRPEN